MKELGMNRLRIAAAFALTGVLAFPLSPVLAKKASPVATLDTDNDKTVDLTETNKAAEALFDKLDKDKEGTLDKKELQGRLTRGAFAAADPDKDGTLTRDEFLSAVSSLFKDADPDNDGTLDAKELASTQGKALVRVTH
jgi:hypothetical protein